MARLAQHIIFGALGGIGIKMVLDVIFYLMHSTYIPFPGIIHFLPAFFLGAMIVLIYELISGSYKRESSPSLDKTLGRITFTLIIVMTSRWLLVDLSKSNDLIDPERSLFVIRGFVNYNHELIIAFVIILLAMIHHLISVYRHQQEKVKYSLAEIESYKKEQAEYRFGMLQAQVDPHFLFNSLNTLASLVHTDTEAASTFVRQLSGVYRNVLQRSKEDLHSLDDELKLLDDYCGLISIRFKNRVNFQFAIDKEMKSKKIAPLSLQLLIENAVKHNVVSASQPLDIKVFTDKNAYIHVVNPLRPKQSRSESSKTGLQNIKNRFRSLTDREVFIENAGEEFKVSIPLID